MADGINTNPLLQRMADAVRAYWIDRIGTTDLALVLVKTSAGALARDNTLWTGGLDAHEADYKGAAQYHPSAGEIGAVYDDDTGYRIDIDQIEFRYDSEEEGEESCEVGYLALIVDVGSSVYHVEHIWPLASPFTFEDDEDVLLLDASWRAQNPPWPAA